MEQRPLFGGAMAAPNGAIVHYEAYMSLGSSQFRQVPDNQEVFVDTQTQQSLIIELLEPVEATDEAIAKFHFEQLASDNEAVEYQIVNVARLQSEIAVPLLAAAAPTTVHLLHGTQKVAKFNEAQNLAYNVVEIMMAVVRLENVQTDIVISINAPIAVAPGSSETNPIPASAEAIQHVQQELMQVLAGLQVVDWGLFGS